MGLLQAKITKQDSPIYNIKGLDDIYNMFQESNQVLLSLHAIQSPCSQNDTQIINEAMDDLLEPFQEHNTYVWAQLICSKFRSNFSHRFQQIWTINRQQFYKLLLENCNINIDVTKKDKNISIQQYFYSIAIHQIETNIRDSLVDQNTKKNDLDHLNGSILQKQQLSTLSNNDQHDIDIIPLALSFRQSKIYNLISNQIVLQVREQSKSQEINIIRIQNSSLLLPETIFADRTNINFKQQITDLLKYYKKLTHTIHQIICSNNLVSCPLKNFIFCLQEKLARKKINPPIRQKTEQFLVMTERTRKLKKTRQINNNLLLQQIKYFLQAYTSFVMIYLQLYFMSETRVAKIVNQDIVYGIIFKHVWSHVKWIIDRGYEYEDLRLQQLCKSRNFPYLKQICQNQKKVYFQLLQSLRDERQPQQYLKKVVILYRQVSKKCQNADDLLSIYEQSLTDFIKQTGTKGLKIFNMCNIIQKLLRVDENCISGGEIRYAWATWCILIQLLKQKIKTQKISTTSKFEVAFIKSQQNPSSQTNSNMIIE